MPLQATSGAASYDAFGGGVAAVPNYIEECFSAFLYTGNNSTQTITNGIDLSTKGGMTWIKSRSIVDFGYINDTVRGANKLIATASTGAEQNVPTLNFSYLSNGFSQNNNFTSHNQSGTTYASWTFRKQPKFFDVVTYTGNDTAGRTIAHNLGSVPGCIIVKPTNSPMNWFVYHRSLGNTKSINLNLTSAATTVDNWGNTTPTSTVFTVDSGSETNQSGVTYVAYLFAHNAGGFGLTGTDNVISCGSMTGTASNQTISLGWEPQFILYKRTNTTGDWQIADTMRGWLTGAEAPKLQPNLTAAEGSASNVSTFKPTASGMEMMNNANGETFIYIAIRRGPMKVPTSGTSVFTSLSRAGTSSLTTISSGSVGVVDTIMAMSRNVANGMRAWDRLRGVTNWLGTYTTQAETAATGSVIGFDSMTGVIVNDGTNEVINTNSVASPYINYMFKRAPSFFDEVCYTGTGSARTINHNLGVAPELMIVKARVSAGGANRNWAVYASSLGAGTQAWLNTSDAAFASSTIWANTSPTASVFSVSTNVNTNYSGATYVAYLFATCPGVSKVGSYTGNGTTQTINCGFTSGARFILIRKTNDTQSWYVFDSARGIVSGNDPVLLLNTTDSEFTAYDSVDPNSTGFVVNSDLISLNDSGGNYIFLAIA